MTTFQIISLIPAVIGYIVLSVVAYKKRKEDSVELILWRFITGFVIVILPLIAFSH